MGNWIYFDQPVDKTIPFAPKKAGNAKDALGKIARLIPGPVLGAYGASLGTLPLFAPATALGWAGAFRPRHYGHGLDCRMANRQRRQNEAAPSSLHYRFFSLGLFTDWKDNLTVDLSSWNRSSIADNRELCLLSDSTSERIPLNFTAAAEPLPAKEGARHWRVSRSSTKRAHRRRH
jgi:hypothetical protein